MKKVFFLFLLFVFVQIEAQVYSLKECVEIALMNKETLKTAALDIHVAKSGQKESLSNILPSISFGSSWSETHSPIKTTSSLFEMDGSTFITSSTFGGVSNNWGTSFSVNQTIYDGGQWSNQIRTANNNLAIAKQFARRQMINVILRVHQSFFQFLKAQQLLDVAKSNLDLARRNVELVSTQYELGAVKKTDLLKAQVQLGKAQIDVLIMKTSLHNEKLVLRNSMGLMGSKAVLEIVDHSRPFLPVPELEESKLEMVEYNPSLLAKRSQINSAELNRKIIGGMRLPSVNASVGYGINTNEIGDVSQLDDWTYNTSLSLSIPLFTGYSLFAKQQQAELNLRKEQYDYITQKNDLEVQLANLLETLENYQDIIPIDEDVLASAEEDMKLVQEMYSLGSLTILEVLDAQVSVTQARSSLVTTKYDARTQEAQLRAILGTLDQDYR